MKRVEGFGEQRGIVLLVALIMLLLVSLMVVTGFNLSQTNLQVVHNLESRTLAKQAAVRALEQAITSGPSFVTPLAFDYNADGVNDVEVAVTCEIIRSVDISKEDIDRFVSEASEKAADASSDEEAASWDLVAQRWSTCVGAGNSLCKSVTFEWSAIARDQITGARMAVVQGVTGSVSNLAASSACS